MFDINYLDSDLVINSDRNFYPIIKQYLEQKGFNVQYSNAVLSLKTEKHDLEKLLQNIMDFLNQYDDKIDLDDYCKKIIQDKEQSEVQHSQMVDNALKIKSRDREYWEKYNLDIPKMSPNVSLKWYQKTSVMHAVTIGNSANFSVPGSGKTWMAYSTFFKLKHEKNEIDKLLIIAPLAAFRPWEIEYKRITGETSNILRLTGNQYDRRRRFARAKNYEIFLISYSTSKIESVAVQELLNSARFMIIVDESHNIKNVNAQQTGAILEFAPLAKKRMILSGTMMPKNILDLWSQFTFLYPNQALLSNYSHYEYINKTNPNAITEISNTLNPYFTRVSKTLLNLPPPTFNPSSGGSPIVVQMSPIQRRIYDHIAKKIMTNLEQIRNDALALEKFKRSIIYLIEAATDPALLTKDSTWQNDEIDPIGLDMLELLQNYPRLKDESLNKLDKTIELAKESLEKGQKVIIWCSFIMTIKKLARYFDREGYKSILIYGQIPKNKEENEEFNREKEIEKFKTDSNYNVLIANPATLAESISLHRHCHHAIYVDRTFNGGHYMQSLERIHRIGLDPSVETRYDIIQSAQSIDQTIHHRLEIKKINLEQFFNSAEMKVLPNDFNDDAPSQDDYLSSDDFNSVIEDLKDNVQNH